MNIIFGLLCCLFAFADLSALPPQTQECRKEHGKHFLFTPASFAGKYDMSYHHGGGSRSFNGVIIIDKKGKVTIPVLTGFVFTGVVTEYSYPSPQTGTLSITDPLLGIATLTFPNPVNLTVNNSAQIFARERNGKVSGFSGSFVSLDTFIQLLNVTRIHESSR